MYLTKAGHEVHDHSGSPMFFRGTRSHMEPHHVYGAQGIRELDFEARQLLTTAATASAGN